MARASLADGRAYPKGACRMAGASRAARRFLGALVLGLGVALVAAAAPPPPPPLRPAVAAIVELSYDLAAKDVAARAKAIVEKHDSCDISQIFTSRGAGLGSAAKVGHGNSIDGLVRNWAGAKPPTREELETHQKDLLRVARVLQAMAELAPHRLPHVNSSLAANEKVVEEWRKVGVQFKQVTREFHDAIQKKDASEVRKVAIELQKTCAACHAIVGL